MRALILLLTILVLACGGDNDVKNDLVGSWVAVNAVRSNCDDTSNDGETSLTCTSETCERYIFSDSSTYVVEITEMSATLAESGNVSISGDQMTLCEEDEDGLVCVEFTFAVSGNTLFLTGTEEDTGCTLRTEYTKEG